MDTKEVKAPRRSPIVRENRFELRVSEEERATIERAAEVDGETSSAFARRAILAAARVALKAHRSGG